jgi:N4-gp56 family major capsid protein
MSQLWSVPAYGGYMWSPNLSKTLGVAQKPLARFRAFCAPEDAVGKNRGELFSWNVYSKAETRGRAIQETETMPKTRFSITQGTLTITEYGNSIPFTKKLDDLSEHDVKKVIDQVLRRDAAETMDAAAHAQFSASLLTVTPASGNSATAITIETTGTATAVNNVEMKLRHVALIATQMEERNITPYEGNDYFCVGRPATFEPFQTELEDKSLYVEEGFTTLRTGEIGRYRSVRFVKQTNIASEAWANAKSDAAFFFGDDAVVEGVAIPEEMRGKIPTDFGRDQGIAWYGLMGFGIVHNAPGAVENRIIRWESAS